MKRSQNERLLRNEQANEYDKWYMKRGEENVFIEDEAIKDALSLNKTNVFLDIGCGTGRITFELANEAKMTIGLDISDKSIEIFNKKNIVNATGIVFDLVLDDVNKLLIEKADKVLCMQVIQHIKPEDVHNTLLKMKKLMIDRASIIFEMYNYSGINRKIEILKSHGKIKKVQETELFYEYRYTPKEFENLLQKAGYVNIKSYGINNFSRSLVNRFGRKLYNIERVLQKTFISKYLGYYFITKCNNKNSYK